jgi:hypothetical protein
VLHFYSGQWCTFAPALTGILFLFEANSIAIRIDGEVVGFVAHEKIHDYATNSSPEQCSRECVAK